MYGPGSLRRKTAFGSSTQNLPIGVFDSGVGGLTVLTALRQQLPCESFVYFGDTAHVPYGTRQPSDIQELVRQILTWMAHHPVKMAVMACNTSSALALDIVRQEFNIPILGIILPGAKAAVHQGQRVGVIATPATVASDCYRRAIQEIDAETAVFQVACPEFVPLIERNEIHLPRTRAIVRHRLEPLLSAEIDTLVYGCTHYPHLAPVIADLMPDTVTLVDPAHYMAIAVEQELELLHIKSQQRHPTTQFFVSGCAKQFAQSATRWLGKRPQVRGIVLKGLTDTVTPPASTADVNPVLR